MARKVIIEDESHAEWQKGEYLSVEEAFQELKRRAAMPWNESPNVCPCTSWKTCDRQYYILEFDDSTEPWTELKKLGCLKVSANGTVWSGHFENGELSDGA